MATVICFLKCHFPGCVKVVCKKYVYDGYLGLRQYMILLVHQNKSYSVITRHYSWIFTRFNMLVTYFHVSSYQINIDFTLHGPLKHYIDRWLVFIKIVLNWFSYRTVWFWVENFEGWVIERVNFSLPFLFYWPICLFPGSMGLFNPKYGIQNLLASSDYKAVRDAKLNSMYNFQSVLPSSDVKESPYDLKHGLLSCIPTYRCPNCPKTYRGKYTLKRHLKLECGKIPTNKCQFCGQLFVHKHRLLSHIRSLHTKLLVNNYWELSLCS